MSMSATSLQLQMASLRNSIFEVILSGGASDPGAADFASLLGEQTARIDTAGRNLSLRDPEAAYRMMTEINRRESEFKTEHAALQQMSDDIVRLESVGHGLEVLDTSSTNQEISAKLEDFVAQYNAWEDRYDDQVAKGGTLDNIQAAEVALWEMECSVRSIFPGAADGIRGLSDLGIEIDAGSKQARFDPARLQAALSDNRTGAIHAIDEFSAAFTKSADLLNGQDNFMRHALENRSRAMEFIASHRSSLEQEFGTGDPVPRRAIAAYTEASLAS